MDKLSTKNNVCYNNFKKIEIKCNFIFLKKALILVLKLGVENCNSL